MNIPTLNDFDLNGKKVLLRADLDVGETLEAGDDIKLLTNKKSIEYLVEKNAKVILMSHRGRPNGVVDDTLSLAPVAQRLSELLGKEIRAITDIVGNDAHNATLNLKEGEVLVLENLRFDPREETNDESFSKELSSLADIFFNDAFSSSAKAHASIVGVPNLLPHGLGLHFMEEIENLSKVFENPKRPVVIIISGVKEDKLDYIEPFTKFADKLLIGGRLPELIENDTSGKFQSLGEKLIIAQLLPDKEDITIHSVERFEKEINQASTIVLAGPVGKFEDEGHRQGTEKVLKTVSESTAFKVAGGGDTEQAVSMFGLRNKFDWISVGGGAMLDFLANGTLPGIEALKK